MTAALAVQQESQMACSLGTSKPELEVSWETHQRPR
jgi:hypothetical protein